MLTPYLAQLRELRDAMDGSVSDQDASDLAAAIRLGDATNEQGGGQGAGGNGGGGEFGGGSANARSRVRVATGEGFRVVVKLMSCCRVRRGVKALYFCCKPRVGGFSPPSILPPLSRNCFKTVPSLAKKRKFLE